MTKNIITRRFYIANKNRYTEEEERELIEFCKKDLEKCTRFKTEWGNEGYAKCFESLNKRVLALYKMRRGGV